MNSLQSYLKDADSSLADRIERLSGIIEDSASSEKKSIEREVMKWIMMPEKEAIGAGIAGTAKLESLAPVLYSRLQKKGFTAGDYNRLLVSLGMIDCKKAADYIADNFLKGRTKSAALVALMTISPKKTERAFYELALKNPEECTALAEIGLLQAYMRKGLNHAKKCLVYIPSEIKRRIPKYLGFPEELAKACRH